MGYEHPLVKIIAEMIVIVDVIPVVLKARIFVMIVYTRIVKTMNKHKLIYFIKQKFLGLVLVGFGILIPFVLDGDATASVIIVPMGLFALFTKERFF